MFISTFSLIHEPRPSLPEPSLPGPTLLRPSLLRPSLPAPSAVYVELSEHTIYQLQVSRFACDDDDISFSSTVHTFRVDSQRKSNNMSALL